jgi:hypothetical protein
VSHQPVLADLFVVEVEQLPKVPIAPSASIQARHCSAMGAQKAEESRETLWTAMLGGYAQEPLSDAELSWSLSVLFGRDIPPSTISARRSELIGQGLVHPFAVGTRKNPKTQVSNSLWGLTEKGRQR